MTAACGTSESTRGSLDWETTPFFAHDLPNVQVQAFPHSGDTSGVDIYLNISSESLVFVAAGDSFSARTSLEIQIFDDSSGVLVADRLWRENITVRSYAETQRRGGVSLERRVPVGPGSYLVRVTLSDENTNKEAVRQRRIRVHDTRGEFPVVGEVNIRVMEKDRPIPFLGLHLGMPPAAVELGARIHNVSNDDSLIMNVTLLRVRTDTVVPKSPYAFSDLGGTLERDGVHAEEIDTVFRTSRAVAPADRGNEIKWIVRFPSPGLYLVLCEGVILRDDRVMWRDDSRRPVAIMPPGFPRPTQLADLLLSQVYITSESEIDTLLSLKKDADRRKWFERFWLERGGEAVTASKLIKQYYSRVEEANLHFSSFEEGWRTDRGMIYVVKGPPVSIKSLLQGELWNYSGVEGDKLNSYFFRKIPLPADFDIFDHYVLDRQAYYDQSWFSAVDRWRRGSGF